MLNVGGLCTAGSTLTVTQGSGSGALNLSQTTKPKRLAPGEQGHYALDPTGKQPNELWEGMSVTSSKQPNGTYQWSVPTEPQYFARVYQVEDVFDDQKLQIAQGDFTLGSALFDGARVEVWRFDNSGARIIVETTSVGANVADKWRLDNANQYFTGTTFQDRLPTFGNLTGNFYWGVAAYSLADNEIGAVRWSAPYSPGTGQAHNAPVDPPLSTSPSGAWSEGGSLPAPGAVTVAPTGGDGGTPTINFTGVPGADGYVRFISYSDPANIPAQRHIDLGPGHAQVLPGDIVVVHRDVTVPDADFLSNRASQASSVFRGVMGQASSILRGWNSDPSVQWQWVPWSSGDPNPSPANIGRHYLRVDLAANAGGGGEVELLNRAWNGSNQPLQDFYTCASVGQVYRWRAWVRASRPVSGSLNMGLSGGSDQSLTIGTTWQLIDIPETVTATRTSGVGTWRFRADIGNTDPVTIEIAGQRLSLDGLTFGRFDQAYIDASYPGLVHRQHDLVKDFSTAISIPNMIGPAGSGTRGAITQTLHGYLEAVRDAGGIPHLQVEPYHRTADWEYLAAYLAAPVSSGHPAALQRAAQGQVTPWIDIFDRIIFEFGNESWNGLTGFRTSMSAINVDTGLSINGATSYGLMCRAHADAMEANPFWQSAKINWLLGGRIRNVYSRDIAVAFAKPCKVGIANYNGGWDEGDAIPRPTLSGRQNALAVIPTTVGSGVSALTGHVSEARSITGLGFLIRKTCYEAGPGYQLSGLNGASLTIADEIGQELIQKSRGAATATLETACFQAANGFCLGNFFQLIGGSNWSSMAVRHHGGGVHPTWQMVRWLGIEAAFSEARQSTPLHPPDLAFVDVDNNPVLADSSYLYTFIKPSDPTTWILAFGNRSATETKNLRICTKMTGHAGLTIYRNVGDLREHNRWFPGLAAASTPRVNGALQMGNTLTLGEISWTPNVGDTFTLTGDPTTYTVTDNAGFEMPGGTLSITPALSLPPADNTAITFNTVNADGYVADPTSVSIDIQPEPFAPLADPSSFYTDDLIGASPAGLLPGNSIIAKFEGVTTLC